MQTETVYRVVTPSGEPAVEKIGLSPRLDSLDGKVVGFSGTACSVATRPFR
jgi:hypothetical protein